MSGQVPYEKEGDLRSTASTDFFHLQSLQHVGDLRSTASTDDSLDLHPLQVSNGSGSTGLSSFHMRKSGDRHEELKRSNSSNDVTLFGNSGGRHEKLKRSNSSNDVTLYGKSIDGASDTNPGSISIRCHSFRYERRDNPYLDAPGQSDESNHTRSIDGAKDTTSRSVITMQPSFTYKRRANPYLDTSEQSSDRVQTGRDTYSSNRTYTNPSFDPNEEPTDLQDVVSTAPNQTQDRFLQDHQSKDTTESRSWKRTSGDITRIKRFAVAFIVMSAFVGVAVLIGIYLPSFFQDSVYKSTDCFKRQVHLGETAIFKCSYDRTVMETVTSIHVNDASDLMSSLEPIKITINNTHNFTVSVRQWTMNWTVNDDNVTVTWSKSNTTCFDNLKINIFYFNETSNVVMNGTMDLTISDGQKSLITKVDSAIESDSEEIQYKLTGEGYGGCTAPSLSMTLVFDRVGEVTIPMDCATIDEHLRFFRCIYSFSRNTFEIIDNIEFPGPFQKNSTIHPKQLSTDLPCTLVTKCEVNKACRLWCKIQLKGNMVDNVRVTVRREGPFSNVIATMQPTSEKTFVTAGNGGRIKVYYSLLNDVVHFNMTFKHTECIDDGNYSIVFSNSKTLSMKVKLSGLPNFCQSEQRFPIGTAIKKQCSICLPDLISKFQVTKRFYNTETNSFQVKVIGNSSSLAEGIVIKLIGKHNVADIKFYQNVTSFSDHANFSIDFTYGDGQSYIFKFRHMIDVTCTSHRECRVHRSCEAYCKLPTKERYENFSVSLHRDGYIKENLAILSPSSLEAVSKYRMKMYIAKVEDGIFFNLAVADTRCIDAGNYSLIPSSGGPVYFSIYVTGLPSYCSPEDEYALGGKINESCIFCVPDHVKYLALAKVFYDTSNRLRKLNLGVWESSTNPQITSDQDGMKISIDSNMMIIHQVKNLTCLDEAQYIIQAIFEDNSSLTHNFSNKISVPENMMTSKMVIDSRGFTNQQNATLTYEAVLGCSASDIMVKMKAIDELIGTTFIYAKTIKKLEQQNQTKLPNTLETETKEEQNHTIFYNVSVNAYGIIQLRLKIAFHPVTMAMNNTLFTGSVQLQTKSNISESVENSERVYVIFETTKDVCPTSNSSCNYAHPYYNSMYLGCSPGHDHVEVRPCPPGTTTFLETEDCNGECV